MKDQINNLQSLLASKDAEIRVREDANLVLMMEIEELKSMLDVKACEIDLHAKIQAEKNAEIEDLAGRIKEINEWYEEEYDKREKLEQRLKDAEEVIGFYADVLKWEHWNDGQMGALKEWNTFRPEIYNGGKRAREYQSKYLKDGK
jgi:predicted RNase H-like nuclease (RuvC/YqgF family)